MDFSPFQLPGIYLNREVAMHEGVVSRNTSPLENHHLLMTESLLWQKVHFWTLNGINGSMASPGRAPIVRKKKKKKSVTKKQTNKCMVEI